MGLVRLVRDIIHFLKGRRDSQSVRAAGADYIRWQQREMRRIRTLPRHRGVEESLIVRATKGTSLRDESADRSQIQ